MKHSAKRVLTFILALMTAGVLLSIAWSYNSDTLRLTTYPDPGTVKVDPDFTTQFAVFPQITDTSGADVTDQYYLTFQWTLNSVEVSDSNYYDFPANMEADAYTLKCTVSAFRRSDNSVKTTTVTWYPKVEATRNISVTISKVAGKFSFTDTRTYSGMSIFDEICQGLNIKNESDLSKYTVSLTPSSTSVASFSGTSYCTLNNLGNAYITPSSDGTWSAPYRVSKNGTQVLSGTITVTVEPYVGADVYISTTPGQNTVISKSTFTDFWAEKNGAKAKLNSVYITSCSGLSGVLCYDHTAGEKSHSSSYGMTMYTSPYSYQRALKDLTFVPSTSGNSIPTGTVTINFTAKGTDSNNKSISITGSIAIFYNSKDPSDITYNCLGTQITLSSNDFDEVYRKTTGSTAKNPIYTVRFLDLPSYGTLYRNYTGEANIESGSIALTEDNLSIMTFSSSSTGEHSLDRLVYIPTVSGGIRDSVRYLVYSGTQPLYIGTISFTSREFVITYTTIDQIRFSSLDFYAGTSPLLNAEYIVFDTPDSGTLYKDLTTGSRVRSSDHFSYSLGYGVNLLDNVTFVPDEDFTGIVEIPFTGKTSLGASISGKVRIYVVAREVFEDVDPDTNWAAPYINRLHTYGIVSGTSETTFSPDNEVTYGQALKMILLAAGYPPLEEPKEVHWATNYLLLAYQNGIIPIASIDLDLPATRNVIAVMAAKALGLKSAESVDSKIIAPVDTTNGFVYALYNAGIVNGSFENGANYFHGDENIKRGEMAKIICKINDYIK